MFLVVVDSTHTPRTPSREHLLDVHVHIHIPVHAFVVSRVDSQVDYCLGLLAGAPKKTTDKLQRVLNAAAREVSNSGKYDRGLAHFRRHVLHWLDVADRIRFRLCI